ncbi:hypothetical protein EAH80_10285 [Mycobacterium hodleri]|uniref:Uncharacterized protein n=1 Tax=Mycolicibacterium hodleri TaxID=49897 RepID=A0A502ECU5_9MYCO|nr:hypothetical protein EAH80_10285 [Mycolicibacterium hodleri]
MGAATTIRPGRSPPADRSTFTVKRLEDPDPTRPAVVGPTAFTFAARHRTASHDRREGIGRRKWLILE